VHSAVLRESQGGTCSSVKVNGPGSDKQNAQVFWRSMSNKTPDFGLCKSHLATIFFLHMHHIFVAATSASMVTILDKLVAMGQILPKLFSKKAFMDRSTTL